MSSQSILYSVNTKLAYKINQRYYQDVHWVFCTPCWGCTGLEPEIDLNPVSSRPLSIYRGFQEAVDSGDRNNPWIEKNRAGLRRGAEKRLQDGLIDPAQRDDILTAVEGAEVPWFKPLVYIMVQDEVRDLMRPATAAEKGRNDLSVEYIIDRLPRDAFKLQSYHDL